MFTKSKTEPTHLEEVIDQLLTKLEENDDPTSDSFARIVDQLDKLYKMAPKTEPLIKPEAILGVVANLSGIIAILGYEHSHVLTSKALGFVKKILV